LSLKKILKKPAGLLGFLIVTLFYAWSLVEGALQLLGDALKQPRLGWILLPYNPFQPSIQNTLLPPSLSHLMGTDDLGRDIFSRVLYAAPTDAFVSVCVVAGGVAIGALLGLSAGFFGGATDETNMRLTDLFLAFPALILALTIEYTFGRGALYALVAMLIVWWPTYARLFRAEALRIKKMKYIDAALLSGLSGFEILRKHFVRPALNTVLSYFTIDLGNVILFYSVLSFLGLGVQPPYPEWGTMVASGLNYFPNWWWYSVCPGIVITVVVIGAALLGDALRDVLAGEL
jgi:peptide/nickel transport system permease protein